MMLLDLRRVLIVKSMKNNMITDKIHAIYHYIKGYNACLHDRLLKLQYIE